MLSLDTIYPNHRHGLRLQFSFPSADARFNRRHLATWQYKSTISYFLDTTSSTYCASALGHVSPRFVATCYPSLFYWLLESLCQQSNYFSALSKASEYLCLHLASISVPNSICISFLLTCHSILYALTPTSIFLIGYPVHNWF